MNGINAFDPNENPGLVELKRRWDGGQFGLDGYGMYDLDKTLDEAEMRLYGMVNQSPGGHPHDKVCNVCNNVSRNHTCDPCYQMVRAASRWNPPFDYAAHPCFVCAEGEIMPQICVGCMELFLGQ